MLDDAELLEHALREGFEPSSRDGGNQAWFRDGVQVSPVLADWRELMAWLRRELNQDE
jgi:hypothetical protein